MVSVGQPVRRECPNPLFLAELAGASIQLQQPNDLPNSLRYDIVVYTLIFPLRSDLIFAGLEPFASSPPAYTLDLFATAVPSPLRCCGMCFQLAARMEHEQVVTRCQEKDPGGPGAANAWEVRNETECGKE